ncbi:uncharacterized protein LOC18993202 [Eutrema salsugineum]|nr:uncharacterized protein LOC18993202 [Eutrema salsugineum]
MFIFDRRFLSIFDSSVYCTFNNQKIPKDSRTGSSRVGLRYVLGLGLISSTPENIETTAFLSRLKLREKSREEDSERLVKMMEEGPPAPKVLRMIYFVGAGFLCTFAINKWREIEKNSILKQQETEQKGDGSLLNQTPADSVQKAMK